MHYGFSYYVFGILRHSCFVLVVLAVMMKLTIIEENGLYFQLLFVSLTNFDLFPINSGNPPSCVKKGRNL